MCVINHTYRFIFVHIPKNAGTSMASYLSEFTTYRDQEIGATPFGQAVDPFYLQRFGLTKHSTADQIKAVVGSATFTRYHVFAIVRNPYARAVSTYRFMRAWDVWKGLPQFLAEAAAFARMEDVNEFVASDFFWSDGPDNIFAPQVRWLTESTTGGLLMDSLLRVEELEQGTAELLGAIGLPGSHPTPRMPRLNQSLGGSVDDLDQRSMEIIERRYGADFAAFGYSTVRPRVSTRTLRRWSARLASGR